MLIKASYIITMGGKGVIKDGYLAFNEEGKITYVGKEKLDEGDVLNLEGRIIIPGLINAHTHVAMTVLRGLKDDVVLSEWLYNYIFPAEARLKAEQDAEEARLKAEEEARIQAEKEAEEAKGLIERAKRSGK